MQPEARLMIGFSTVELTLSGATFQRKGTTGRCPLPATFPRHKKTSPHARVAIGHD